MRIYWKEIPLHFERLGAGDEVQFDDGAVLVVRGTGRTGKSYVVNFVGADSMYLRFEESERPERFEGAPLVEKKRQRDRNRRRERSWHELEGRNTRTKLAVKVYAGLLLERGGKLRPGDWHVIGTIHRPDMSHDNARPIRAFLRTSTGIRMTARELRRLLSKHGINAESVVSGYKDIMEQALVEGDLKLVKSVLDRFSKMLGIDSVAKVAEQPKLGGATFDIPDPEDTSYLPEPDEWTEND